MTKEEKLDDAVSELAGRLRVQTARADAAERMLAGVMKCMEPTEAVPALCSINTGLASWWADWQAKYDRENRVAQVRAKLAVEEAAVAATKRELAALTPASAASPGAG